MSNMNKITYGDQTILDDDLAIGGSLNANLLLYQSLIGEALQPDTFTFYVIHDENKLYFLMDKDGKLLQDENGKYLCVKDPDFNPENYTFGSPLNYYINDGDTIVGTFYVRTVKRVHKKIYRFDCTSAIGLTTYYGHNGDLYRGETVGTIVADIMGSIPYTIDADLAAATVKGWLPKVKAARDNLQALFFMAGGSVKKTNTGEIHFGYLGSGEVINIPDTSLSVGGSNETLEPATRVEVTSHEYFALQTDEEVVLYDNTGSIAADHLVVDFTQPCHDLKWNGSDLPAGWDSNANYCVVTGIGTLTGKKYTHTTSVYAIDTGVNAAPNVIQVDNNFVINPGNVANVAKRIKGYYSIAKEVNYTMRVNGERPGDQVSFTDPWGDVQTGFIKSMNINVSKKLNAEATIALNWTPGPFGDSYTDYAVFDADDIVAGRLTFPDEMVGSASLIVLLGGAGGGQAGYDGEDGEAPSSLTDYNNMTPGQGGRGGAPGQPGERGNMFSFYEDSLPAFYDNAVIGEGGDGGASNGELGLPGGDTTLGSYSSADGVQLIDDYINFLDGTAYGSIGLAGEAGSDGGIGSGRGNAGKDTSSDGWPHYCYDGNVIAGGAYANGANYSYKIGDSSRKYRQTGGAGGGGAAHNAPGSDGYASYDRTSEETKNGSYGGDGGSPTAPNKNTATRSGHGGHGGGGGGGATQGRYYTEGSSVFAYGFNHGGVGGLGSVGGEGGDGLIIVYYNAN